MSQLFGDDDVWDRLHPGRQAAVHAIDAVCTDALAAIHDRLTGMPTGVHSGIPDLEALLGPLRPGGLYLLAGDAGAGRLATALHIIRRVVSGSAAQRVLLVTLDGDRIELVHQLIATISGIPCLAFDQGCVPMGDRSRITAAAQEIGTWPLEILDPLHVTMDQLRFLVEQRWRTAGEPIRLMVIDDLHQINAVGDARDEWSRSTEIARGLKILAQDLGIPVLAVARLRQDACDGATTPPHSLADLRHAGPSQRILDAAMLLHVRGDPDPSDVHRTVMLCVALNRYGPTGSIALRYWPTTWRVEFPACQ